MLHHVSLPVSDLPASAAINNAVMEAIGYRRVVSVETAVGYGIEDDKHSLLLVSNPNAQAASKGFHLAFAAPSRGAVRGVVAKRALVGLVPLLQHRSFWQSPSFFV